VGLKRERESGEREREGELKRETVKTVGEIFMNFHCDVFVVAET